MDVHSSITIERVSAAIEQDEATGLCVACGEEQSGCEPDAREYQCESCGERTVYGAEELLFTILLGR